MTSSSAARLLLAVAVCLAAVLIAACASTLGGLGPWAGQERPMPRVPQAIRDFHSEIAPVSVPAPVRLRIPAIGVDTRLERLGRHRDRTVEVPRDWDRPGWYAQGPRPGEPGSAVILGHLDSPWGPAVFAHLSRIRPGMLIMVDRADGSTATFRVTRIRDYPRARFPVRQVYWPTAGRELRLITCAGRFQPARDRYRGNRIVFAVGEG